MEYNIFQVIYQELEKGRPLVLCTIVNKKGSAPRKTGTKMLITEDGDIIGTIGGGILEKKIIEEAKHLFIKKRSKVVNYKLTQGTDSGMICGGVMDVFFDYISPEPHLIMIGAGHVGGNIVKIAKICDFNVTVIDSRKDLLDTVKSDNVSGVNIIVSDFSEIHKKIELKGGCYVIVATNSHENDEKALYSVLHGNPDFIGMIGSKTKARAIFKNLIEKGIPEERVMSISCPLGIDIGAETESEVALSIVAEVVAQLHGASGGFLGINKL